MGHRKNRLRIAVRISPVKIALDHIVAHQAVNDIGALALGGAEHEGMPQQLPFIDEAVGADPLALAEIFEGVVGVQRLLPHLELLSIAGGVEPFGGASVDIGQVHLAG